MPAISDSQTANTFGDQQPSPTTPPGVFGEQTLGNDSSDNIKTTTPPKSSKISRKKAFLAIIGVVLVIGAVVAGVFLVQEQQDLREQASSASECDHHPDCVVFDNPGNEGVREVNRQILHAVITNQPGNETEFGQGNHDDGCYIVNVDGNTIHWQKYGSGPD